MAGNTQYPMQYIKEGSDYQSAISKSMNSLSQISITASFRNICLAILGLTGVHDASKPSIIRDDSVFYGESPPVYPSPIGNGTGTWSSSYVKAAAMVAKMTLEEKSSITFGRYNPENLCHGSLPAIPRLGFPGMCLMDAGNGVRGVDFVNSYPSGLHVGASWNKDLARQRGVAMGGEFRAKGANIALGPVVGPVGRIAEGGRNWEGFSNDPYLCGSLGYETVQGIQGTGVITSTKHFIGNEQETNRVPTTNSANEKVEAVSSNIDDKTLHEIYLWPFQDAIHAGSGNIMCSYQRLNNSYACSNSKALNGLLKTELGFNGFVVSDWNAQHSGVATALAGMDMAMPDSQGFWGDNLIAAVNNGSVPISRLDDMATRIIATWYQLGQDKDYPPVGVGVPPSLQRPHAIVDARNKSSKAVLLQGAIEGHVLVKNTDNILPLKSPKLLSVFGYDAIAARSNNAADDGWEVGWDTKMTKADFGTAASLPLQSIHMRGTVINAGGSGTNTPSYISSPFDALQQRAYEDGTFLMWDFVNNDANSGVEAASEICIVFINSWSSEGADRPDLRDDFSDSLVNNIANQCENTIVVIHNAGIRIVDRFIDNPNVKALIFGHLPGQDSGRAVVSLLYGDSNPSGKLPYTVPKNESDFNGLDKPSLPDTKYTYFPQSNFSEGVYIDYRAFDKYNITPRYEFGFGLSYTTFSFSNLQISKASKVSTSSYPTGEILEGGQVDLWDIVATVTAEVSNTGDVQGMEVAQLYIGIPNGPVRQLRGFEKVDIKKGGKAEVSFDLTRRDLSEWDTVAQKWKLQKGKYGIWVGSSSRDLPLNGSLTI